MELLDTFDAQEIVPRLWLSDYNSSRNRDELKKRRISHILAVMAEAMYLKDELFEVCCSRPYSAKRKDTDAHMRPKK